MKRLFTTILFVYSFALNSQVWYSQVDPKWSNNLMNNTCTIGSTGCVITDISMIYNENVNPGNFNSILNTACSYSSCSLKWNDPTPAGFNFYGLYNVTQSNYLSSIYSHIANNRRVILEFKKPNSGTHWVLVPFVSGPNNYHSSYIVYDPGTSTQQTRNLGSSAYSGWIPTRIAVYASSSAACEDNYEPNNSFSTAVKITPGASINAVICNSSDLDIYKFYTSNSQPYFRVNLQELPTNYKIEVYRLNNNGTLSLVGGSNNSCKLSESVVSNSTYPASTYFVKVFGSNSFAYHAKKQYNLKAEISNTPLPITKEIETRIITEDELATVIVVPEVTEISVYPNPAFRGEQLNVLLNSTMETNAKLILIDLNGKIILEQNKVLSIGYNNFNLTLPEIVSGFLIVQVITESGEILNYKIIVE